VLLFLTAGKLQLFMTTHTTTVIARILRDIESNIGQDGETFISKLKNSCRN